jgi:CRP-like cAMP-binding protein
VDQSGFLQSLLGDRLPSGLAAFELRGTTVNFPRHASIFKEGDPADHVYLVCRGVVRRCRLHTDGKRHVAEFHLRGDLFGTEDEEERQFAAEAASACALLSFPRLRIDALAATEPQVALYLYRLANKRLRSAQSGMMLNHAGALERLAAFLLDLQSRMAANDLIPLRMSYLDIGDHLGLAPETVCRAMTWLRKSSVIDRVEPHLLRVRDLSLLQHLAGHATNSPEPAHRPIATIDRSATAYANAHPTEF